MPAAKRMPQRKQPHNAANALPAYTKQSCATAEQFIKQLFGTESVQSVELVELVEQQLIQ